MPLAADLQDNGIPVGVAAQIGDTVGTAAAAGSTIADATALTKTITNVNSVATGQGVALPQIAALNASIGISRDVFVVNNTGTASLAVYPASTDSVNKVGAGTSVAVGTAQAAIFYRDANTHWTGILGAVL